MKKNISAEQFNSLSVEARNKLTGLVFDKGYSFTLSIGEMIEFLDEHDVDWMDCAFDSDGNLGGPDDETWEAYYFRSDRELCDALWSAVKEVLETK